MEKLFSEYLRQLRVSKGYTLTQLGAMLGIDSGALSKIENGKKRLDEKNIPKIAQIFDLKEVDLKEEYISEQIAISILENSCSENVLELAKIKLHTISNNVNK